MFEIDSILSSRGFYKIYPDSIDNLSRLINFGIRKNYRLTIYADDNTSLISVTDVEGQRYTGQKMFSLLLPSDRYTIIINYPGSPRDTTITLQKNMDIRISQTQAPPKICLVLGVYKHDVNVRQSAKLTVRTVDNEPIGVYKSNEVTGEYLMSLPNNSGDFIVTVETEGKPVYSYKMHFEKLLTRKNYIIKQEIGYVGDSLYARSINEISYNVAINTPYEVKYVAPAHHTLSKQIAVTLSIQTPGKKPAKGVEIKNNFTGELLGQTDIYGNFTFSVLRDEKKYLALGLARDKIVQTIYLQLDTAATVNGSYTFNDYAGLVLVYAPCDTSGRIIHDPEIQQLQLQTVQVLQKLYPKKQFVAVDTILYSYFYEDEMIQVGPSNNLDQAEGKIQPIFYKHDKSEYNVVIIVDDDDILMKNADPTAIPRAVFTCRPQNFISSLEGRLSPQNRANWHYQEQQVEQSSQFPWYRRETLKLSPSR
jgi:hypothetical protein